MGLGWCTDREFADSHFDGETYACMVADCRVDAEVIGRAIAGSDNSGNPTYPDLVAVAKRFMCCIELRDAMTL